MLCAAPLPLLENNVIEAIHALEEMEDIDVDDEIKLPKVNFGFRPVVIHPCRLTVAILLQIWLTVRY